MTGPACEDASSELFFLREGEPTEPVPERFRVAARMYCADCPVRTTCGQQFTHKLGLWAGIYYYYKNFPKKSRVYKTINLLSE